VFFVANSFEDLLNTVEKKMGKRPNLDSLLFLVGVQELGKGPAPFSKEQKQDLMHIAVCKLLSQDGYYKLEGLDPDGWPIWTQVKKVPFLGLKDQEQYLKSLMVQYFELEYPDLK
jgi:hypothetical protein